MQCNCQYALDVTSFCTVGKLPIKNIIESYLDDWLTVHHSLVDLQLDTQNSCLFIYNTFIKILYMFRALPCLSSGGLRLNCIYMQPLVSSLSAGDCPLHRLRKQRVTKPEAAYIQLRRRPPEDEQGNVRNM